MDLQSGFWQIKLSPSAKPKTAFITPDGLFQFERMPFGLCNGPSTFQRLMDVVLAGLQWGSCLCYMDDIIVYGKTFDEHLNHLEEVLVALKSAKLRVKMNNCRFGETEVKILGHIVSSEGIRTDPEKTKAIAEFPEPKNVKAIQSFIRLCGFYRKVVKNFSEKARPLTELTKKNAKWNWGSDQ